MFPAWRPISLVLLRGGLGGAAAEESAEKVGHGIASLGLALLRLRGTAAEESSEETGRAAALGLALAAERMEPRIWPAMSLAAAATATTAPGGCAEDGTEGTAAAAAARAAEECAERAVAPTAAPGEDGAEGPAGRRSRRWALFSEKGSENLNCVHLFFLVRVGLP